MLRITAKSTTSQPGRMAVRRIWPIWRRCAGITTAPMMMTRGAHTAGAYEDDAEGQSGYHHEENRYRIPPTGTEPCTYCSAASTTLPKNSPAHTRRQHKHTQNKNRTLQQRPVIGGTSISRLSSCYPSSAGRRAWTARLRHEGRGRRRHTWRQRVH